MRASDKSHQVYAQWVQAMRRRVRELITPELIAEHERKPLGQHSDALERVLNFFRRAPQRGKYAVLCTVPFAQWRIVVLSGNRGARPTPLDDRVFDSEEAALHAVFVRRVADLDESSPRTGREAQ